MEVHKSHSDDDHKFLRHKIAMVGEKKHEIYEFMCKFIGRDPLRDSVRDSKQGHEIISFSVKKLRLRIDVWICVLDGLTREINWDDFLNGSVYVMIFINPSDSFAQKLALHAKKLDCLVVPTQQKSAEETLRNIVKKISKSNHLTLNKSISI